MTWVSSRAGELAAPSLGLAELAAVAFLERPGPRETGAWTLSGELSRDSDPLTYRVQLLDSRVRFEAGERVVRVETPYQIVARRSHDRNTIHAAQSWPDRICP